MRASEKFFKPLLIAFEMHGLNYKTQSKDYFYFFNSPLKYVNSLLPFPLGISSE